jgi:hypothetical protein
MPNPVALSNYQKNLPIIKKDGSVIFVPMNARSLWESEDIAD